MGRRGFIRLAGGGAVLAASAAATGCTPHMPAGAIAPWRGPGAETDVRRWVLAHALLAPHSHNMQSWQADLRAPGEILLRCDLQRLLPETDPFSRQILMSHGTFLELLDIAARERGLRAETTLFPEGTFGPDKPDTRPVARVRLMPDPAIAKDPLYPRIFERHTNRGAYDIARPVPPAAWTAMAEAAAGHPVRFAFVGSDQPQAMDAHRAIAAEAWRIELTTPRAILESYKVLRVGPAEIDRHRDGLSVLDPLPVLLNSLGLFDRDKAPGPDDYATTSQIKDFNRNIAATAGFLWMVSEDNERATQVNAGRAYARVQLAATAHGLAMQPLQQALQEYPEQARPHAAIRRLCDAPAPGQTVQMWARVGYGPPVEPAPRRGLEALIV